MVMNSIYFYYQQEKEKDMWGVGGSLPRVIPENHYYKYNVGPETKIGRKIFSCLEKLAADRNKTGATPKTCIFIPLIDFMGNLPVD